jgi:hypothetical protein
MFVRRPILPGADQRVNGDILGRRPSLLCYE